jgi:hypothetical protein
MYRFVTTNIPAPQTPFLGDAGVLETDDGEMSQCDNYYAEIRSGSLAGHYWPNLARRDGHPTAEPSLAAPSGNVVRLTQPKARFVDRASAGADSDFHRRRMKAT